MFITVLLLLVVVFWNCKVIKGNSFYEDYLSFDSTVSIRGICVLVVIYHHLSQVLQNEILLYPFLITGYLCVSVFFFFSGYGVMYSYKYKKDYLKNFFRKRIFGLIIPFFIINLLYFLILEKGNFSVFGAIEKISGIILVNIQAWYIHAVIYFYVLFFITVKITNKEKLIFLLSCLTTFIYIIVCILFDKGRFWYNSCITFNLGVLFAYKKEISESLKKFYFIKLLISFSLLISLFLAKNLAIKFLSCNELIKFFLELLTSIFFIFTCVLIFLKLRFSNKISVFLGQISLELYLIHNLFLILLRKSFFDINSMTYYISVLFFSILSAIALNKINLFYKKWL